MLYLNRETQVLIVAKHYLREKLEKAFSEEEEGQSAIEYLTTYGWMLLAVSAAASVTYTQIGTSCPFEIEGVSSSSGLSVEQLGAREGEDIKMVVESQTFEKIKINSISLESQYSDAEILPPVVIEGGESAVLDMGKVQTAETCETLDATVNYDKGPIQGQSHTVKLNGPMALNATIELYLKKIGDTISTLEVINSSVRPANLSEGMCIGGNCPNTDAEASQVSTEEVLFEGDEMLGTLRLETIQAKCYGANCPISTGNSSDFVQKGQGEINGTINVTEIKPVTDTLSELEIN